jgi:hypothetical protein
MTQTIKRNVGCGIDRIRGRHHGFDIEWSRERFGEVIRHEIAARSEQGWPVDRIWRCVRTLYEMDERSSELAKSVFDEVLRGLRCDGVLPRHRM